MLNHYAFDENNPAGAVCLETVVVPERHTGPLHDRYRPDRCANCAIGPEHIPICTFERHTLLTSIAKPGLSATEKQRCNGS